MKLSNNLADTALMIANVTQSIINNPNIKTEKGKKVQITAQWKNAFSNATNRCNNPYEAMIIHAYCNTVTSKTMNELPLDDVVKFMNCILKKMHSYKGGEFDEV